MFTSYSTNQIVVDSNLDSLNLEVSTSTSLANLTISYEEERELLFHIKIWVQNIPLHMILDNGSQKNFVFEDIVNKLDLSTTPHPQPYNISWMKDGQELKITR